MVSALTSVCACGTVCLQISISTCFSSTSGRAYNQDICFWWLWLLRFSAKISNLQNSHASLTMSNVHVSLDIIVLFHWFCQSHHRRTYSSHKTKAWNTLWYSFEKCYHTFLHQTRSSFCASCRSSSYAYSTTKLLQKGTALKAGDFIAEGLSGIQHGVGGPVQGVAHLFVGLIGGEASFFLRNQLEKAVLVVSWRTGGQICQQLPIAISWVIWNET